MTEIEKIAFKDFIYVLRNIIIKGMPTKKDVTEIEKLLHELGFTTEDINSGMLYFY